MTTDEALVTLGNSTAEVVLGVLSSLCSDGIGQGAVSVVPEGASPLESIEYPTLVTSVSYVDGVAGGNLFAITPLGARRLAANMMFQEPPSEDSGEELDELELSALGEAMNQMMAAAAAALGHALGYEVEISVPTTQLLDSAERAQGVFPQTPHATVISFTVLGDLCRLIQLVPNAFVVRMTRALTDRAAEEDGAQVAEVDPARSAMQIRDFEVRVAAELGRATMPLARAVALPAGAIVELDRDADEPLDLYVNGQRFATGQLVLIDQTEWAIRIERLLDVSRAGLTSHEGGI